tara:strand:+ start:886 stop:1818 length:933 start_codon:yes stop_codon:yes gene_type:complete
MTVLQVLLIAGTHGNEINAPWLMDQAIKQPLFTRKRDFNVVTEIGNPLAFDKARRYIDNDLNRSFRPDFLSLPSSDVYEIQRAKFLIKKYGVAGTNPCHFAIDLHTTTSSMGGSLVIYGRRPADLALAALVQHRLGLPIYLHEDDNSQKGFLVEAWPCGLVVEIGPVAQSLLDSEIVEKNRLILQVIFDEISKLIDGIENYPDRLIVYSHIGSIDYPRDQSDQIKYLIHPDLKGKDWHPISDGCPIFIDSNGEIIKFEAKKFNHRNGLSAVFINEAAYAEKKIAMSIAKKETLYLHDEWKISLNELIKNT